MNDDATRSRYDGALLALAERSPWWWSLAGNPACRPWCARGHDPADFRVMGSLVCSRSFGEHVWVEQAQVGDPEWPFRVHLEAVVLSLAERLEGMTPEQARGLAGDLAAAAAFAQQVCR